MREQAIANLQGRLNVEEGVIYKSYRDTKGYLTGGRGHLMTAAEQAQYPLGTAIPAAVVAAWATADFQEAQDSLATMMRVRFSFDVATLPDTVWEALVDLTFNMGAKNLSGSGNTLRLIILQRYQDAAAHLLENVAWVNTVRQARADAIAGLIEDARNY